MRCDPFQVAGDVDMKAACFEAFRALFPEPPQMVCRYVPLQITDLNLLIEKEPCIKMIILYGQGRR